MIHTTTLKATDRLHASTRSYLALCYVVRPRFIGPMVNGRGRAWGNEADRFLHEDEPDPPDEDPVALKRARQAQKVRDMAQNYGMSGTTFHRLTHSLTPPPSPS